MKQVDNVELRKFIDDWFDYIEKISLSRALVYTTPELERKLYEAFLEFYGFKLINMKNNHFAVIKYDPRYDKPASNQ